MEIRSIVNSVLIETLGLPETAITPDAHLGRDLGVDSLDFAELVMEFETKFDIRIPHEDAENIQYVQDIEDYIIKKISQ